MYCEYFTAVSKCRSVTLMYCQLLTTHNTCHCVNVREHKNKKNIKMILQTSFHFVLCVYESKTTTLTCSLG